MMSETNVSTARVRKHRTLQAKREIAAEHGITLHEDVLVGKYPDGYVTVQRWDAEAMQWVAVLSGYLRDS
jgi:hypothetical protein